ncbi:MAG: FAD-dependent oxidoreductase [Bacteroidota bacterium]
MNQETTQFYDIVVVGAGMSGMYAAWKLAASAQKARIALFEMAESTNWGGRVETVRMGTPDAEGNKPFKAEFGPMRFEREGQKELATLVKDLGLEYSPFPPYQSSLAPHPTYQLKGEEARWKNPLLLLLMGILKILDQYKPGMTESDMFRQVASYSEDDYEELRQTATQTITLPDGTQETIPLWQRGFWNALSDALSHQAILKIRDTGNFYHLIPDNPNAIEWIIFWLRGLQPHDELVGIKGGSCMLSKNLLIKLKEQSKGGNLSLFPSHKLISLEEKLGDTVLTFEKINHPKTVLTVKAGHVILGLPKTPLLKLSVNFPVPIRQDLEAVINFPLLKCFFVTRNPWWDEDISPQTGAWTMPTREVHYYQEHVMQLEERGRKTYEDELNGEIPLNRLIKAFGKKGISLPKDAVSTPKKPGKTEGWVLTFPDRVFFIQKEDLSIFDKKGAGMVMVYTDRPASEYWNDYVADRSWHDQAEICKNPKLKHRFVKYLSEEPTVRQLLLKQQVEGKDRKTERLQFMAPFTHLSSWEEVFRQIQDDIIEYGLRDWGLEPYGAGCHAWRPNCKSWEVRERIQAFALLGNDKVNKKNIHICGEAYSDYQGFIEGALRTANKVIGIISAS